MEICTTTTSYTAQYDDELTFEAGADIYIVLQNGGGWYYTYWIYYVIIWSDNNLVVYQLRVKRNYLTKFLFDRCTGMLNGRYGRVQESQIVLTAEGTGGGELAET